MRAGENFTGKLRAALRPYLPEARYLVGVSGGRDSVALLSGLVEAGFQNLIVCHLNHGLRGEESRADAEFVRHLGISHSLPVEVEETDVKAFARSERLSLETAAREARHRFFALVAERRQCRTLFLAHQADDQAETMLFNLLRGAGPVGLSGMQAVSTRRIGSVALKIVRPLLAVWREEVDAYLAAAQITWREDATNADPAFGTRNRLRAEVLPMLARVMGRDVKPALWRAALLLGEERDWLDQLEAGQPPPPDQLPVKTLRTQPLAERRRTVHRWLRARGVPDVGYQEVAAVLSLVEESVNAPAKVNLPGGCHARRRAGSVFLEPAVVASPELPETGTEHTPLEKR